MLTLHLAAQRVFPEIDVFACTAFFRCREHRFADRFALRVFDPAEVSAYQTLVVAVGYVARCVHIDNEDVEIILEESQILAVDRRKGLLWPRRYGCRCLFQEIPCMSR
ncbi:hypothetical protein D3C78_1084130 [compost metagenome]